MILLLVVACVGCGTTSETSKRTNDAKFGSKKAAPKHGFQYIEGVGWKYIPQDAGTNIMTMDPIQVLEHVDKAINEERYDEAMFGAKHFIQAFPLAEGVPKMRRIVAEVYEKKGLKNDALKVYEQLLFLNPENEKTGEIKKRMEKLRGSQQHQSRQEAPNPLPKDIPSLTALAKNGNWKAQHNLGAMYEHGLGAKMDIVAAYVWYSMAATNGSKGDILYAARVGSRMTPDQESQATAMAKKLIYSNQNLIRLKQ